MKVEPFTFLLLAVISALVFFLWKSRKETEDLRRKEADHQATISSDITIVKSQLQSLSATVGDIGAIKSQVETVGTTMQDLPAIKSQVETLSSTAAQIGGIKSQVEALSTAIQDLGAIKSQVESMNTAVQDLGAIKSQIETISTTTQTLVTIKSNLESLQQHESQLYAIVQTISSKLIGSREVGAAGENLLAEAFASFPPGWIERDFKLGGKVVEFALVLPNHKRLPIDSKWPAIELLQRLGEATDPDERLALTNKIEDAVTAKAQEASKYIDPAQTIHLAMAAIPDSAYSVCRKAHFQAIKSHVLVVSYSMALPIVLALYRFQLEYAASVDQEHLESHLKQIEDCLQAIEEEFQNRLSRGSTMILNAYTECMTRINQIKASLSALRAPIASSPELPPLEAAKESA